MAKLVRVERMGGLWLQKDGGTMINNWWGTVVMVREPWSWSVRLVDHGTKALYIISAKIWCEKS